MEPTASQLQTMNLVSDAIAWAQLTGELAKDLMSATGAEDTDHVRVLASISDADWSEVLANWTIDGKYASPAQRAKAEHPAGAYELYDRLRHVPPPDEGLS